MNEKIIKMVVLSTPDCLFCKIVQHQIPANVIYEDNDVVAFLDINPVAPFHCLIIPKLHFSSVLELPSAIMVRLLDAIKIIVEREGLAEKGFRIVSNCGSDGGQLVPHIHWHLLGGRQLNWPPG